MHNAPAVSFPVGRSRFQAWFLSVAWLAGAAACAYWASGMDTMGWRQGFALAMPIAAGVVAWASWVHWQRSARSTLRWDGQCWRLETPAATSAMVPALATTLTPPLSLTGDLAVHLDFQSFLLLSMRLESGGTRWLWLDPCAELNHWQAFRRAVHSSASGKLRPAGSSNAASTGRVPSQRPGHDV